MDSPEKCPVRPTKGQLVVFEVRRGDGVQAVIIICIRLLFSRTPNQLQKSFRGSQSSLQSRQSSDVAQHLKDRPTSAYISNKDSYNLQNQVRVFILLVFSRVEMYLIFCCYYW